MAVADSKVTVKPAVVKEEAPVPVAKEEAVVAPVEVPAGRVDEFDHLRNDAGQLAPEHGSVADPLADEAKQWASSDPTA